MHFIKKLLGLVAVVGIAVFGVAAVSWARDASISISPSSSTFLPGDTITYTVTVNNVSGGDLTGVTHEFSLENSDAGITGSTMPAGPQTIPVDGSASYQVTVQLPADFPARWLTVEAQLLASDGDRLASEDARINLFAPFLSASKTATAEAPRGGAIAYAVTIRNNGFAPANNVAIVDTLPLNLTNVVVPADSGCTFNAGPRTVTCPPFDLAVNQERVVSFVAAVSNTATCSATLTNNVAVAADSVSNASAKADTKIICPTPTPSPTATPTPTPTPTPTSTPTSTATPTPTTSASSASTTGTTGKTGGSSGGTANSTGQVKAAKISTPSSADQNAPGFIPFKNAALMVDQIFSQVFGRKILPIESTYWKARARSDKATVSKLRGAMQFYKSKGKTYVGQASSGEITVADIFTSVYGRPPTASELSYWKKRAVQKNQSSALSGAMLFHKLNKIQH